MTSILLQSNLDSFEELPDSSTRVYFHATVEDKQIKSPTLILSVVDKKVRVRFSRAPSTENWLETAKVYHRAVEFCASNGLKGD